MKNREIQLSQDLAALQRHYNELDKIKDVWKEKFRQESEENRLLKRTVESLRTDIASLKQCREAS